jgi:hypothetical protein
MDAGCDHSIKLLGLGRDGHEWISGIAIEKLPDSLPAFARTPRGGG